MATVLISGHMARVDGIGAIAVSALSWPTADSRHRVRRAQRNTPTQATIRSPARLKFGRTRGRSGPTAHGPKPTATAAITTTTVTPNGRSRAPHSTTNPPMPSIHIDQPIAALTRFEVDPA